MCWESQLGREVAVKTAENIAPALRALEVRALHVVYLGLELLQRILQGPLCELGAAGGGHLAAPVL